MDRMGEAMILWLAFVAGAAEPSSPASMLPLSVGQSWSYTLRENKGAGFRLLGLATQKAESQVVDRWQMRITGEEGGRFDAVLERTPPTGLPSTSPLTLWHDGGQVWMDVGRGRQPALTANPPPGALSTERVPCVGHMLGSVVGLCSPVPGGPRDAPAGLVSGLVYTEADGGAALTQVLVGIATMGVLIPGNRKAKVVARLDAYQPGDHPPAQPSSPLWLAWHHAGAPTTTAAWATLEPLLADYPEDAEGVAAVVDSLEGDHAVTVGIDALPRLEEARRAPVMRVILQGADDDTAALRALAEGRDALGPVEPGIQETLIAKLGNTDDQQQARRLLSSPCQALRAALEAFRGPFDDAWVEAVTAAVAEHPPDAVSVEGMLAQPTFDGGRRDTLSAIFAVLPEDQHADVAVVAIGAMEFDSSRIETIETHLEVLGAAPQDVRRRMLEPVVFADNRKAAAALLGL